MNDRELIASRKTALRLAMRDIGIIECARRVNCDPAYICRVASGKQEISFEQAVGMIERIHGKTT
jgi:hypothetical protein